jgi:hypothetical protein
LKNGEVVEKMEGRYDSYGRVFVDGGSHKLLAEPATDEEIPEINEQETYKGQESFNWQYNDWHSLVDQTIRTEEVLSVSEEEYEKLPPLEQLKIRSQSPTRFIQDHEDGFAAYHKECYNGEIPTTGSKGDPNQGWGEWTFCAECGEDIHEDDAHPVDGSSLDYCKECASKYAVDNDEKIIERLTEND